MGTVAAAGPGGGRCHGWQGFAGVTVACIHGHGSACWNGCDRSRQPTQDPATGTTCSDPLGWRPRSALGATPHHHPHGGQAGKIGDLLELYA